MNTYAWRKLSNQFTMVTIAICGLAVFVPLALIFFYLLSNGIENLSWNFLINLPKPPGETGSGMLHAIVGTICLVLISAVLAIPWGLLTGVYLAEFRKSKLQSSVRMMIDLLNGTPSIVLGIFAYTICVKPFKTFSALAGGIALAIVILPIIVKSVEEILRLIPEDIRHAGLALGVPRWKVILFLVVWGSRKNLLPGILLALARSAGETAPLLFTAFGSMYLSFHLASPIASLPVEIYNYAISPYDEWHQLAWTGSLVLIMLVFMLNIFSKILVFGLGGKVAQRA